MKKILIKQCSPKNCSAGYQELWEDGEYVFGGDSYHNRISDKIDGFLLCLKFLKIDHEIEYESIDCKFKCD